MRRVSDSSSKGSSSRASRGKDDSDDDYDDDDDDDDKPLVMPRSSKQAGRRRKLVLDDSDEEDGPPIVSSPVKRRRLVRLGSSPVKQTQQNSDEEDEDVRPAHRSSPRKVERTGRKPRTEKEKARELLRRKRAGEVIDELPESSSSEDEAPAKALYDTDSDHQALSEFEDDEEGVLEMDVKEDKKKREKKKKKGKKRAEDEAADHNDVDESDDSLEDFIAEDGHIGVPDEIFEDMPLEFTAHAHKPLKEFFRDVVEWLVQFKVNPGFDKTHKLYRMAWKKLDDEVGGLARSKFASSAWRPDFHMALRARPYFTTQEIARGGNGLDSQNCGACGRRGHPAR